jgi:hypothetical protein
LLQLQQLNVSLKQFLIRTLTRGRCGLKKRVIIAEKNPKQTAAAIAVITLPTVYFLILHFAGSIDAWGRRAQAVEAAVLSGLTFGTDYDLLQFYTAPQGKASNNGTSSYLDDGNVVKRT